MSTSSVRPPTSPVALGDLFDQAPQPGPAIGGITLDSRSVRAGDLYVALPGSRTHGARFAGHADAAGAAAVLTDPAGAEQAGGLTVPIVVVDDPRSAMGRVASRLFGDPATAMSMLAVTGTNGKTTTSFLAEAALQAAGRRPGVIGTIGYRLDGRTLEATRTTVTTPESPEVHGLLASMRDGGADSVLMEVSSHALTLGRVDPIVFDVAAFTNFGRDHLDFHGTEDDYFEAKASLFTSARTRRAVINIDDPRGREIADRIRAAGDVALLTTSLQDARADFVPRRLDPTSGGGSRLVLGTPGGDLDVVVGLPGEFNVHNAITVLAMMEAIGVDLAATVPGLATAQVPGRMQRVDLGAGAPIVIVDFAHTPQAVGAALAALPDVRRLVVLGAGGDRDTEKRGPMGAAAAAEASVVIVTDDNPRTEDPALIRQAVLAGATGTVRGRDTVTVLDGGDRRAAIRLALSEATADDVVVVLGKGHEEGQEINGTVHRFNDVDVIIEEWADLRGAES